MLKTFYSRYGKKFDLSQNIDFLFKILSKIVVKTFGVMFVAIAFSTIYPVCQTDENGNKPGSNLSNADKRVAEPSGAEILGIR